MKRIWTLLLAAVLMLGLMMPAMAEENAGLKEYYVYTENGKPLNVRMAPNGEIVGTLECGTKLPAKMRVTNNWAEITFHYNHPEKGEGDWTAYVSRRFLTEINPEEIAGLIEAEEEAFIGDPLLDIDAEFAGAVAVKPYRIAVRPARVTSWVNMRWIPSETGRIITQYRATEELIVLKELVNYLQVQDPDTGDVGYIHRKFAAK